jgi:hypothetical protein
MNKNSRSQVRLKQILANQMFGIDASMQLESQYFVHKYDPKYLTLQIHLALSHPCVFGPRDLHLHNYVTIVNLQTIYLFALSSKKPKSLFCMKQV